MTVNMRFAGASRFNLAMWKVPGSLPTAGQPMDSVLLKHKSAMVRGREREAN